MNDILNCPNCGAPIQGEKCDYCGTVIYDFAVIDDSKPTYIKMRLNGHLFIFKAILRGTHIHIDEDTADYMYADDKVLCVTPFTSLTVEAEFQGIVDNDILFTVKGDKR